MSTFAQLLLNGAATGCIYGLIALGFVLIYKATEMLNFAQGDLLMLGAFVAFTCIGILGMPYWAGLAITVVALGAFGYLLDFAIVRRVIGQPQFTVVMLTIGLGYVLRSGVAMVWGSDTEAFETPFTGHVVDAGSLILPSVNLSIVAGTLILCAVLFAFFRFTRLGVSMQASSQNQLAAYFLGIPVRAVFSLVWAISAAVAGVAGVLVAPIVGVEPNMGLIGLKAFAAAVLGGFGSIPGAVVGGILIGIIEQFSGVYIDTSIQDVSAYIVLLAVLMVYPQGLFGQVMRKKV